MKKYVTFILLCATTISGMAVADDPECVRNNCLGTCISTQEALHKPIPMICRAQYMCYQDVECAKLEDGKCGWKETPQLKACLQEHSKENPPASPRTASPAAR